MDTSEDSPPEEVAFPKGRSFSTQLTTEQLDAIYQRQKAQAASGSQSYDSPGGPQARMYPAAVAIPRLPNAFLLIGGSGGMENITPIFHIVRIHGDRGDELEYEDVTEVFASSEIGRTKYMCQFTAVVHDDFLYILGNAFTPQALFCRVDLQPLYHHAGVLEVAKHDTQKVAEHIARKIPRPRRLATGGENVFPDAAQSCIPRCFRNHTSVLVDLPPEHGGPTIVTFGGACEHATTLDTLFFFRITTRTWEPKETTGTVAPQARLYHAACAVRNRWMFVFGGAPDAKTTTTDDPVYGDLWRLDVHTMLWQQVQQQPGHAWPSKRGSVSLQYVEPYVFMLGGYNGDASLDEMWRLDVDSLEWACISAPMRGGPLVKLPAGAPCWAYASVAIEWMNGGTQRNEAKTATAGEWWSDERDGSGTAISKKQEQQEQRIAYVGGFMHVPETFLDIHDPSMTLSSNVLLHAPHVMTLKEMTARYVAHRMPDWDRGGRDES